MDINSNIAIRSFIEEQCDEIDRLLKLKGKSKNPLTREDYTQIVCDALSWTHSLDLKFLKNKFNGLLLNIDQEIPTFDNVKQLFGQVLSEKSWNLINTYEHWAFGRLRLLGITPEERLTLQKSILSGMVKDMIHSWVMSAQK